VRKKSMMKKTAHGYKRKKKAAERQADKCTMGRDSYCHVN
jgi:hypothetical protein